MDKIATTTELASALREILAYASAYHPSRRVLARRLEDLSFRVAAGVPNRYLPLQARDKEPVDPEGTDMAIWTYEAEDNAGRTIYYAIAYAGKAGKPLWHHSFGTNEARRAAAIRKAIDDRKQLLARKLKQREDRRNFTTDLFAGDILYTSWGYEQTQVDFYEVIEVPGNQTVVIREVASKVVKGDGYSESVVADPGNYIGAPMRKRVSHGNRVKITSYSSARKWDGRPLYRTGPYGGH